MADIIHLHLPHQSTSSAPQVRQKERLVPELAFRKLDELKLISGRSGGASHYHTNKMQAVFRGYGLWESVVIDEVGNVLAGARHIKAMRYKVAQVPVFILSNLTDQEKEACRAVVGFWVENRASFAASKGEHHHD